MPIEGKVSVGCPPSCGEELKSFQFHFHDFANLSTTRDHYIVSPEFTCHGHQWALQVYPGGSSNATEGQVSAYLAHLSNEAITVGNDVNVVDKFGKQMTHHTLSNDEFNATNKSWGWADFFSRSDIMDKSQNILDSNGTLTVVVSIEDEEEPTTAFVPKNPFANILEEMFNDEDTADVCFEVSTAGEKEDDDGKNKRVKTATPFYAHSLILKKRSPMLAAICGSNDSSGVVTATVNDVKPEIFQHLLSYVYGGSVPEEELKAHAKDIVDAADKYSIVNLKLEAEAAYVESTDISVDNAMDNLLYADSRNCALLKEAVMNFLADNHREAATRISFTDCPGHLMKDLIVAFSGKISKADTHRTEVNDDLTTVCVSALRRKLHKMGLEVDGSREAMIESIKSHSEEATLS